MYHFLKTLEILCFKEKHILFISMKKNLYLSVILCRISNVTTNNFKLFCTKFNNNFKLFNFRKWNRRKRFDCCPPFEVVGCPKLSNFWKKESIRTRNFFSREDSGRPFASLSRVDRSKLVNSISILFNLNLAIFGFLIGQIKS